MKNNNNKSHKQVVENFKNSPNTYLISVHMQNMMATFGSKETLETIKELFFSEGKKRKNNKKAVGG